MKTIKAAISLLLLSSVSALADEMASTGSGSSLPMITAITSGAKPAVDGLNGKAQFFGGASQGYTTGPVDMPLFVSTGIPSANTNNVWYGSAGGAGAVTIPIGHSFGVQFDGLSALNTNVYNGGGAGHFFWRDPDKGLIGAYGSGLFSAFSGGVGNWQAAGEAEAYLGRFTIGGIVGVQGFTNNGYNNFYDALLSPTTALSYGSGYYSSTNPNRFFDNVAVSFYPIDDFKLSAGHIYSGGNNFATVTAEYLLPQFRGGNTAVSAYAEGIIGANNNNTAMAGIKVYFGNHDKTLIRRQREDDPINYTFPQYSLPWNNFYGRINSLSGVAYLAADSFINGLGPFISRHKVGMINYYFEPQRARMIGGSYGGGIQLR